MLAKCCHCEHPFTVEVLAGRPFLCYGCGEWSVSVHGHHQGRPVTDDELFVMSKNPRFQAEFNKYEESLNR